VQPVSAALWNLLLLGWKWAFILLIYATLILVLFTVRREIAGQRSAPPATGVRPVSLAAGKLRVIAAGSVARLTPGALLSLRADNRLGAAADNDVVLPSAFVSAHHARLRWDGAAWWVEDLDSHNGTLAAGSACPPHVPQALPPGAPLQVGDVIFELVEGA
jgi:hypothetical protein